LGLLTRLHDSHAVLHRGVNRRIDPETARIARLSQNELSLRTENFEEGRTPVGFSLFLNASLDGQPLFFVVQVLKVRKSGRLDTGLPSVIYKAERRDRSRLLPGLEGGPTCVLAEFDSADRTEGTVADFSADGLAILVAADLNRRRGDSLRVQFLDGARTGESRFAQVRNLAKSSDKPGWQRLGMSVSGAPFSEPIVAERRTRILNQGPIRRARSQWKMLTGRLGISGSFRVGKRNASALAASPEAIELAEYQNDRGEVIRAIVDSSGNRRNATAVVIPPAWGKTKETLLPLAATIVETFRSANEPVVVIRYDGIRKRGESYNEEECKFPGREHHKFAYSQGVRDIQTTLNFLDSSEFRPLKTILVTFSAAAIEGRRAVAMESERLSGWISVVGTADIQSAMRVVSGGVDYVAGAERGVLFGIQEVQGVTVDMDLAAADAIANGMAFLEDARLDMAQITTPVSWIHGQFDAWMDLARIQTLLGVGRRDGRRLVVVPTGHQLRSSKEALQVFQLVASEVGRLALGRKLAPELPDLASLKRRGAAERRRLPEVNFDRRKFWRDYLLGREGRLGIELMTATSAYGRLMNQQQELLAINPGDSVVDLGCGTGSFLTALLDSPNVPTGVCLSQVDYVADALRRIRGGGSARRARSQVHAHYISADLELMARNPWIPFADSSQDAVIASLLISYVRRPEILIGEAFRVLRPGGRFVLSALRPDADTSRIFVEGAEELRRGRALEVFGEMESASLEESFRSFLNDAARLLELEERGVFHFWPEEEISNLLKQGGFSRIRVHHGFGTPPQALIAVGKKP
jgi:ubiquinone/menaquinone biosynthesis C-methylase UbiE